MARDNKARRLRIKRSIRRKISGTAGKPRLSVYRSNQYIYAQIVDDLAGVTLAGASSRIGAINSQKVSKTEKSKLVGQELARRAAEKGIQAVVFDRNGFRFHGRIKALADGAREGGLKF